MPDSVEQTQIPPSETSINPTPPIEMQAIDIPIETLNGSIEETPGMITPSQKKPEQEKREGDNEESQELIKRLKITSLIISILAGVGSVIYYIYSMMVGDTVILKPADTVIIQNSDLQLDQAIAKDKASEQSVINKIIELQKSKRDFIPLDYYVGKIEDIEVITPKMGDPEYYNGQRDINLSIKKTYDIMNKKRSDESVNCRIDKVNSRYFQKWVTMSGGEIDIPSKIKIRNDDILGFRYTTKNNQNTCEIFQVNEINLEEYITELDRFSPEKSVSGSIEISGKIEGFFRTNMIAAGGPISSSSLAKSNYNFYYGSDYNQNSVGVMMTVYSDNNPRLPLVNIICELKEKSAQELPGFFRLSNLDPKEDRERFVLGAKIIGQPKTLSYTVMSVAPVWFPSFFYKNCDLEKIDLLDMGERNVIDSHTFEN